MGRRVPSLEYPPSEILDLALNIYMLAVQQFRAFILIVGRRTHGNIVFLDYAALSVQHRYNTSHGELPTSHFFRIITN